MSELKEYKFDVKLKSKNIKLIDQIKVNMDYQNIECDRCNSLLKYINILRIDDTHYNIGNDCYNSIKNRLSKIRHISLHILRFDLESNYDTFLGKKHKLGKALSKLHHQDNKYHRNYSEYVQLKYDNKHGKIPKSKIDRLNKLKAFFNPKNK